MAFFIIGVPQLTGGSGSCTRVASHTEELTREQVALGFTPAGLWHPPYLRQLLGMHTRSKQKKETQRKILSVQQPRGQVPGQEKGVWKSQLFVATAEGDLTVLVCCQALAQIHTRYEGNKGTHTVEQFSTSTILATVPQTPTIFSYRGRGRWGQKAQWEDPPFSTFVRHLALGTKIT